MYERKCRSMSENPRTLQLSFLLGLIDPFCNLTWRLSLPVSIIIASNAEAVQPKTVNERNLSISKGVTGGI